MTQAYPHQLLLALESHRELLPISPFYMVISFSCRGTPCQGLLTQQSITPILWSCNSFTGYYMFKIGTSCQLVGYAFYSCKDPDNFGHSLYEFHRLLSSPLENRAAALGKALCFPTLLPISLYLFLPVMVPL